MESWRFPKHCSNTQESNEFTEKKRWFTNASCMYVYIHIYLNLYMYMYIYIYTHTVISTKYLFTTLSHTCPLNHQKKPSSFAGELDKSTTCSSFTGCPRQLQDIFQRPLPGGKCTILGEIFHRKNQVFLTCFMKLWDRWA